MQRFALRRKLCVGHRRDQAGVQPAGEERRHRHVGDKLPLNGVQHQVAHLARRGGKVVGVFVVDELPVAVQQQAAGVGLIQRVLAGQQFAHVLEHAAARRAAGAQQQHLGQALGVDARRHRRVRQQRLDLAAEQQAVRRFGVKQRLDAAAVPRQEQLPGARCPHRKRKNAVEAVDTGRPPLGIGVQQHFGVGPAGKSMPARRQHGAQFCGVIQLAVIHQRVAFALPVQLEGLAAVFGVHHGQARVQQRRPPADVQPALVRPAARQRALHGAVGRVVALDGARVAPDLPRYPTHTKTPFRVRSFQNYAGRGLV